VRPLAWFTRPALLLLLSLAVATPVAAWWNESYKLRTQVVLNTSQAGVPISEALSGVAVPVRLHSGNFDFLDARTDGSDLRVLAADDKTPLRFQVERYDAVAELAVLWVAVPTVAPGTDTNLLRVYAAAEGVAAEPQTPVVDSGALLTLRFDDPNGAMRDAGGALLTSTTSTTAPTAPAAPTAPTFAIEPNGMIGQSARFDAGAGLELAPADRLRAAAGAPFSLSLWARPALLGGTLFAQGPLTVGLDASGKVVAGLGRQRIEGGALPPSAWVHIGLTVGAGRLTLYVDGTQAAQADLAPAAPAIEGALRLGAGYAGLIDELQLSGTLRSADWMKFNRAAQGADAKLVASMLQREGQVSEDGDGAQGGYIGILVKNLTIDAWVVIGLCGVMLVIAIWVMIDKTVLVQRVDRGNRGFLLGFRASADPMLAQGAQVHASSPLARLYDAGIAQLRQRGIGEAGALPLSGASMDAVKAAVDADMVRESQRLNSLMVLLTIAISGGPFLGLLGTVVGVMITFAAIAQAGDVNVNAIAPGIAAALLATVAGLAVAIPALFGYNYLASRIKNISADMQIFVDEFVTRVAERYGQR